LWSTLTHRFIQNNFGDSEICHRIHRGLGGWRSGALFNMDFFFLCDLCALGVNYIAEIVCF